MSHFTSLFALSAFLLSIGCATSQSNMTEKLDVIEPVEMEEVHIRSEGAGLGGLDAYDAKALFERGQDLLDGYAYQDALPYFERIVVEFPKSPYKRGSEFSRGLCYLNLQQGESALVAFDAFINSLDGKNPKQMRLHRRGRFRKGAALALLKRYEEVAELYDILLVEELSLQEEIEALTDSGIGHFMRGDLITAEYRFMKARRLWRAGSQLERLGVKFFVAQATFYLAELTRLEYDELHLLPPSVARRRALLDRQQAADEALAKVEAQGRESVITAPSSAANDLEDEHGDDEVVQLHGGDALKRVAIDDNRNTVASHESESIPVAKYDVRKIENESELSIEELIGKQLEKKCQLLLRAQVSYLRVIREGHVGWASAAGYRVGTLYESLYDEMVALPSPDDLTESQRVLYRKVMRERVGVLLRKAIGTWEATAQMASRTDSENEWVEKTRLSLERLRGFLEESAAKSDDEAEKHRDAGKPS